MTRRQLRKNIIIVMSIYLFAAIFGIVLRLLDTSSSNVFYETFKESIPFILAIPAAYLGYCFQQRGSYMKILRTSWSEMVSAINSAIEYTFIEEPTQQKYSQILLDLSIVIDELRGVYKNIGEKPGDIGLYPYEPIKDIHRAVRQLGYVSVDTEKQRITRRQIVGHWKSIRENFLAEFDRAEPTKIVSPYVDK